MEKRRIGKRMAAGLLSIIIMTSALGCISQNPAGSTESGTETVSETVSQATPSGKTDQKTGKESGMSVKENSTEESKAEITYLTASELTADYSKFDLQTPEDWSDIQEMDLSQQTGNVTITAAGVYRLTGSLSGSLTVEAPEDAKVVLMLDGCTITSGDAPAIEVLSADKVMIYTVKDSENVLKDTRLAADSEDSDGAALYSKCALVLSGEGVLKVESTYNNGIQSKKTVKLISGEVEITSVNHGIKAKNQILIKDGSLTVNAGGDALKTTEDEADGGLIYIEGGTLELTSVQDGIDASNYLKITDGSIRITTTAPQSSSGQSQQPGGMGGFGGQRPGGMGGFGGQQPGGMGGFGGQQPGGMGGFNGQMPGDMSGLDSQTPEDMSGLDGQIPEGLPETQTGNQSDSGDVSAKGLKAGVLISIDGGDIRVNATDDGIHTDGTIQITAGDFTIQSQDDAVHADEKVEISGGKMTITAHEGIEATYILITEGTISIQATDDGINAARKSDLYTPTVEIAGGSLTITMGAGDTDGIDSNGNLIISGGVISITGSSGFDCDGSVEFTGGTVYVNGEQVTTIPNQMMGGQFPGGGRR